MRADPGQAVEVSSQLLDQLGALVGVKMGLQFGAQRRDELRRVVLELSREKGAASPNALVRSLLASSLSSEDVLSLAGRLTTGETYFFREQATLDALRTHVLPELVAKRWPREPRLRIWCAGCSSGEEAYTMAMLVDDLLPEPARWSVRILGTDINPQALEKARQGVYGKWSFRGVDERTRMRFFQPAGPNLWAVKGRYKRNVVFSHLNLATDSYPALFNDTHNLDLIVCRNVMIYLLPQTIQQVAGQFYCCLADRGWLIVSPSETSRLLESEFSPVYLKDATLYRKLSPAWASQRMQAESASPTPCPAPPTFAWAASSPSCPVSGSHRPEPENPMQKALGPDAPDQNGCGRYVRDNNALVPNPASQNVTPGPEAAKAWEQYEQARLDAAHGRGSQAASVLEQLFGDSRFSSLPAWQQARALYLMARIQADQGRLEQAAQWGAKAFAADKTHPATLHLLTMIHQELGQDQEAKTALKRLLYLQPDCIAAHVGLGSVAMRGNKRAEARRHFHNALHLLSALPSSALVPEMDDLPAGRVAENLRAMMTEDNL